MLNKRVYRLQNVNEYHFVRYQIRDFLKLSPSEDHGMIEVAINEALNNGIFHSKPNQEKGLNVQISLQITQYQRLLIRVKDNGQGFQGNSLIKRKNDLDANMEEGGRGLFIMNHVFDKVIYNHYGNEVLLSKLL